MHVRFLLTLCVIMASIEITYGQVVTKEFFPPPGSKNLVRTRSLNLTVSPAKAPRPALRYRLLPTITERNSGNAAQHYLLALTPGARGGVNATKRIDELLRGWENTDKMPPKEILQITPTFAFRAIERGAFSKYCDWRARERIREDGFGALLPELQSTRRLIVLLQVRARYQMAEKKYSEAIRTLRTAFQLSRHVNEGPTLIQGLVAAALASIAIQEVEQLISRPDSPNMYWALTQLPQPLIDMGKAADGEKLLAEQFFPNFRDMRDQLEKRALSQSELDDVVKKYTEAASLLFPGKDKASISQKWFGKMGLSFLAAGTYPRAKEFLLKQGIAAKHVNTMPVTQAVLMYSGYAYDTYLDDALKWYGTPYPEFRRGMDSVEQRLRKAREAGDLAITLIGMIMPALSRGLEPSYRLDRKIQGLRVVEALRMYAAEHGHWPKKLADIKDVPVPNDPYTQAPFVYDVRGKTATIIANVPPVNRELNQSYRGTVWEYVLTLR
ncbi:MAG: hypothetical protein ACFCD0_05850 [Gemmataceae bacterium]